MSLSRDLERLHAIDDATAWTRADEDRMAAWAHAAVAAPPERDLGRLADWACDVTDPAFAGEPAAEQAAGPAERARPTGESAAGATLHDFGAVASSSSAEAERAAQVAARSDVQAQIIEAIQRWAALYGHPPSAQNWNRAALLKAGRDDLLARLTDGAWPTTHAVQRAFGKWADAIEAAGFARPTRSTTYGQEVSRPAAERMVRFIDKTGGPDGCWQWTGHLLRSGYGTFDDGEGRTVMAHRLVYEALVGPIPEGLTIDHLCRVRRCVNPAHLEPVTLAENNRRARASRRADEQERAAAAALYPRSGLVVSSPIRPPVGS